MLTTMTYQTDTVARILLRILKKCCIILPLLFLSLHCFQDPNNPAPNLNAANHPSPEICQVC